MSQTVINQSKRAAFFSILKQSLQGGEIDYTVGSIRRSVVLLAIPMMLEMILESVFALVDLYFVGHLHNSSYAIQTVGLTESVLTVIYSLAIGMSMAATAVVSRRIGEKDPVAASKAGMQAILIAVALNTVISALGLIFATQILRWMGASAEVAQRGTPFMQLMMGSSVFIALLFLINGIFRGAGNAAIAMKSLWVANVANIILCPIFINGFGPIPAYGLTGAAIATTLGRGLGVFYQLYHLLNGKHTIKVLAAHFTPDWEQIKSLIKIASPAVLQFVIASCSWIFLAQLVATTGGDHGSAGKLEQLITKRPNSYVPAHTLERLLNLPHKPDEQRLALNWTMHWGQGILMGMVRGFMAEKGIRGPVGSFLFMNLRLLNDQTLENATGVGALPWTWPKDEQVIDLIHKGIYAFTTGIVADLLVAGPKSEPVARPGWTIGEKA